MKRYIKATSYRRSQDWDGMVAAIRHDIRAVARCNNEAELAAADIHSSNPNAIKHIWDDIANKKGIVDFDEKIDMILDYLQTQLQYFKEEAERKASEVATADKVNKEIEDFLNYDANIPYDIEDDGFHLHPADMSRDALINFIDELIEKLNGKYFATGRGGSWTSWNVKLAGSDTKSTPIEYQIGPSDSREYWLIREV